MLQSFFLWFYCLPILYSILLIIIISAGYLIPRQWLNETRFWRPVTAFLFLFYLAVIAIATLTDRTPGAIPTEPEWIPFHSYRAVISGENKEILRSNFMNIVLFFPAGLLACDLLPKNWSRAKRIIFVTILFALVSIIIEYCQYHFALGQAEADDVIHNTLGALIGALVSTIPVNSILRKLKKSANKKSDVL